MEFFPSTVKHWLKCLGKSTEGAGWGQEATRVNKSILAQLLGFYIPGRVHDCSPIMQTGFFFTWNTLFDLFVVCGKHILKSVQLLSHVRLFAASWTAARQASLSINNSWSLLKLMSIELVMPSNHLILCCPLLHLPVIFPSIKVFLNESALCIH